MENNKQTLTGKKTNSEKMKEEILKKFIEYEDEEVTFLRINFSEETTTPYTDLDIKQKFAEISDLESKIFSLEEKSHTLKLKKALITANLHYEKIKLGAKVMDANILQDSIDELKILIQQNENFAFKVQDELNEISSDLANLSVRISHTMLSLNEMQTNMYLENRLTVYGRFIDYLQPSRYVQILKEIIGNDIFYAHLCDSIPDAINVIEWIKRLKYEKRENFIIFSNYSHKFKAILTASGEKGIEINNLQQMLIFLTKLMHFGVIDEVPILSQKSFNFDEDLPHKNDYFFYIENNLHFTTNGLISYKSDNNNFCIDTKTELEKSLSLLKIEEEIKYQEFKDLIQILYEIKNEISFLENDILYFQKKSQNPLRSPTFLKDPIALSEIYQEYRQIFIEYNLKMKNIEREYIQADNLSFSQVQIASYSDERMLQFAEDLKTIQKEKNETEKDLMAFSKKLRLLCIVPSYTYKLPRCLIKFDSFDKSKLFFEKEFKELKKLITDEDLADFLGSKQWRASLIFQLNKDLQKIKKKYKESSENLKSINASRKKYLYPLIEHCSHCLSQTCRDLIDSALPFVELNFSQDEENLQLFSSLAEDRINLINIKHFNIFLRFICVISLFLEIAKYTHTPLMVFEELEDFIPKIENFSELFSENLLKQLSQNGENLLYHLLMRIGQYLKHQINKNTKGNYVRRNENYADYVKGPMQIIYFAKGDFFQAADHYIWIHNQVLPDDFITEDCDSYSRIEEVQCPFVETF